MTKPLLTEITGEKLIREAHILGTAPNLDLARARCLAGAR